MCPSFRWRSRTRHRLCMLLCHVIIPSSVNCSRYSLVLPHCSWAALVPRTWPVLRSWNRQGGDMTGRMTESEGQKSKPMYSITNMCDTWAHALYACHYFPGEHLYELMSQQWEEGIVSNTHLSTAAVKPEVLSILSLLPQAHSDRDVQFTQTMQEKHYITFSNRKQDTVFFPMVSNERG